MEKLMISGSSLDELGMMIGNEIVPEFGKKVLEFGSCACSIVDAVIQQCDYLALTDKDPALSERFSRFSEDNKVQIIPDSELGEDCYFGRFHLVYTLFGFHDLPHLVDEIMRLRRLILKGGKIAAVDFTADGFAGECTKQLKRCGFQNFKNQTFMIEGKEAFLITAEK